MATMQEPSSQEQEQGDGNAKKNIHIGGTVGTGNRNQQTPHKPANPAQTSKPRTNQQTPHKHKHNPTAQQPRSHKNPKISRR